MVKEKKQKKTASEADELDYNLTDFDYDGPVTEEKYKEDEADYEIDYDSSDSFDDD